MNITTQHDLGDEVCVIYNTNKQVWEGCSFCKGVGEVKGNDGTHERCPRCHQRRGKYTYEPTAWKITVWVGHVASIRSEVSEPDRVGTSEGIRYMLRETGCPSGTLHPGENVFATVEEAQAECERRNEEAQP